MSLRPRRAWTLAAPLAVVAHFVPLATPGLGARFALDDMMNLAGYFRAGWVDVIAGQFQLAGYHYRPAGGLFYLVLFDLFGLDPFPYRAVVLSIMAINAGLAYLAARMLSGSTLIAAAAAVLTSYHGRMFVLIYNTSQVYDILCFLFWFLAFCLYVRLRLRGGYLNWRQTAAMLTLYLFALNSKEMAATLPVLLAAFEWAYGGRLRDWRRIAPPIVAASIVTLAVMIGKATGPDPMTRWPAYHPVFTVGRFLDSNAHFAGELLYLKNDLSKAGIVGFWAVLGYLAFRRKKPHLRWAWVMTLVGSAPIAFLPGRGGGCLYIPLFGSALFAATLFDSVVRGLSREPLLRWVRVPAPAARAALVAVALAAYTQFLYMREMGEVGAWRESQNLVWDVLQDMRRLKPKIQPGSKILFLTDPFQDFDMMFITTLALRDPRAEIALLRKEPQPLTPEQEAAFDHVLTWRQGRVELIR